MLTLYTIYVLLAIETIMALRVVYQARWSAITNLALGLMVGQYISLGYVRWIAGPHAYRQLVISTRWMFWLVAAMICLEAVRLLSLGASRHFAIATSLLFAAGAAAFAWASMAIPGEAAPGMVASRAWALACTVFVGINVWFYSRVWRDPDESALQYTAGAIVMMASTLTAFLLLGWGWVVTGLLVQRVGGIAGLGIWMRK